MSQAEPRGGFHPLRLLRAFGALCLTLILAGLFLLAVVMGQPLEAEEPAPDQPLLTPTPAQLVSGQGDLTALIAGFPAPVLACTARSGWTLVSGSSFDMAFEGGFGRVARLVYTAPDGTAMIAESYYPARALSLMGKSDFRVTAVPGIALAGENTVRMVSGDAVRYHLQTESGLYAVTIPLEAEARAGELVRGLQLMRVEI